MSLGQVEDKTQERPERRQCLRSVATVAIEGAESPDPRVTDLALAESVTEPLSMTSGNELCAEREAAHAMSSSGFTRLQPASS